MGERSQARTIAAWVSAIATFAAVMVIALGFGDALRVPTSLYVGPHIIHYGAGAEAESDTAMTTYGLGAALLSILAGIAAWHLAAGQRFSPEARAHFLGWLTGAMIVAVGGVVLWKLLEQARGSGVLISNVVNAALVGLAAFAGTQLTKSLWRKIEAQRTN